MIFPTSPEATSEIIRPGTPRAPLITRGPLVQAPSGYLFGEFAESRPSGPLTTVTASEIFSGVERGWRMGLFWVACGSVVAAAVLVYLVHRVLPHKIRAGYNEVNGYFFAAIGALYAVLLAFVVVAVWEDMGTAQQNTYDEANAIPGLYFSSTAFPPDVRLTFQRDAVAYTRDVINDEWPALANGQSSPRVEADAKALRKAILQVRPNTDQQDALYSSMIDRINTINSDRRQRIYEAQPSIPAIFWYGLLGGGVMLVFFALFFGVPKMIPHMLMVTVLTITVAGTLYLTYLMEQPFRGPMSIQPNAYQVALVEMGQPTQ